MTFEEFFKKKRIDLDALNKAEPGLFSEFKIHYEQMGEKSFDHTKKYWFNKVRREYPLPVEVKTDKVRLPNPLAEQTITESLDEQIAAPMPVFAQGSRIGIAESEVDPMAENQTGEAAADASAPKQGFTPRFKAGNIPKSVAEPKADADETTKIDPTAQQENTGVKPAYQPRFNVKNLPKKEE